MEHLLALYEDCVASPAYIHLEGVTDKQEGFVNGWAWAQATAKEAIDLRALPVLREDYGPAQRCGSCRWFVQHYRYTGSAPWYTIVGCGHCMCPTLEKKDKDRRNPVWRGCRQWKA